jgi:predicted RNase H-like nuclease
MTPSAGHRAPAREAVVTAAVALADEQGIEAVATRSVAKRLRVHPSEIGHLLGDLDSLLDAMADLVAGEFHTPVPGQPWREQLRLRCGSMRSALLRHGWAVPLVGARGVPDGPAARTHRDAATASLREAGFTDADAVHAIALLDAHVYGSVVQELAETPASAPGDEFDVGLELVLAAVAGLLGPAPDTRTPAAPNGSRRPPPVEVLAPVVGIDGCRAGWVGALLVPGAPRPRVAVAESVAELVETVRSEVGLRVVGIDIPIGLPDDTPRRADALARKVLGRRASSVFTTLTRAAYAAPTRAEADVVNRRLCGQGVGAQAHALRAKVLEVDAWVRSRPTVEVLEVHPEVCFVEMAGAAMPAGKKTPEGRTARLEALAAAGIARPSVLDGSGYAADDVLDACAVAWTAARRVAGLSRSLPDPPEVFSDGIPAAIHV